MPFSALIRLVNCSGAAEQNTLPAFNTFFLVNHRSCVTGLLNCTHWTGPNYWTFVVLWTAMVVNFDFQCISPYWLSYDTKLETQGKTFPV